MSFAWLDLAFMSRAISSLCSQAAAHVERAFMLIFESADKQQLTPALPGSASSTFSCSAGESTHHAGGRTAWGHGNLETHEYPQDQEVHGTHVQKLTCMNFYSLQSPVQPTFSVESVL